MSRVAVNTYSRLFTIAYGAGPGRQPIYQGYWMADTPTWKQGDVKPFYLPSQTQLDQFTRVGQTRGEPSDPELKVIARYTHDASQLLQIIRSGCPIDLQVHIGVCTDPRDFNGGWDKIIVLEQALPSDYTTGKLGALEPSERAKIDETVPFMGQDYYEIMRCIASEKASTQVVQEVLDIQVVDAVTCGLCGITSDGCTTVMAVTAAHQGSPGRNAELLVSQDAGFTWAQRYITSLPANKDPKKLASVGANLVVVSNEDGALHYAAISDILNSAETWTRVATGFVANSSPNQIFSLGPTLTWIVGDAGYVYFTPDPTLGATVVQDAGVATIQNLSWIHGWDALNLVAVGASNAVIFTKDGGQSWASVTGPSVGNGLNTCWMASETTWWVGDAVGKLWYTLNAGSSWTQVRFPKDQTGTIGVTDIQFSTPTVGWMACADGTASGGRIYRTIDGGFDWYIAPEGKATIPANNKIDALAICSDMNICYAAGLKVSAGDGIIVKMDRSLSPARSY